MADRITETAARLERWCRQHGHHITPDHSVYEDVAAQILERSPGTLRNWRMDGGAVVPYYRPGRGARVRYRLTDLAAFIELQRC